MGKLPWLILLGCGGGGLLILLPLSFGGFEKLIDTAIASQTRLVEGTPTWTLWKKVPIPVIMKIYIFNITNPEEVKTGAKPILYEMGPYVYREWLEKFDITQDEKADTVRYRQVHSYYFQPDMSTGTEDDLVTFINIPFVGVAKMAHDFTDVDFMLTTLDEMLSGKGETMTRTHKVRELLFEGFSVQSFLDLLSDPMVEAAGGDIQVPEQIKDGKMGILEGKNATDDGWYVVKTGKGSSVDFGRVVSWNGMTILDKWKDPTCNAINGTDGMLFAPFITKDLNLEFFIPLMCRSLTFIYTEMAEHDGVSCFRYRMAPNTFNQNAPENFCFCPEKNRTDCNINGVLSLSACTEGAPLYLSYPHFAGGDPSLLNGVVGLKPDPAKHKGYLDIHAKTAVSIHVRHRFQFNIALQPWPAMPTFAEAPTVILPILWLEEGGDIDDGNKGLVRLLDTATGVFGMVKWLLMLGCLGMVGAGGFLFMQYKKQSKVVLLEKQEITKEVMAMTQ